MTYQERRDEKDLLTLKTTLEHRYNDSRTTDKKNEGALITAIRISTDDTMTIYRKQKWEEKSIYGRFKRLIINIPHEKPDVAKNKKSYDHA